MWATPLLDQRDPSELLYSRQLLEETTQEILGEGLYPFSTEVVRCLVEEIMKWREWIYVTCFRTDQGMNVHRQEYGDCCLTFPLNLEQHPFHCVDSQASLWFRPVAYDRELQILVIDRAFRLAIDAIELFGWETIEGPSMPSSAQRCARSIAQIFIGFVVGFKDREFEKEHEWRLACCPGSALAHTAPKMFDESFSSLIRDVTRNHIALDAGSYSRWPSRTIAIYPNRCKPQYRLQGCFSTNRTLECKDRI
jgi:hypothetical protein